MLSRGLFTSDKNYWETPQDFFDELHDKYNFTLDAAATDENAKLDNYYTIEDNSLEQDWKGRVFVVMLIPARTDTIYWHEYIFGKAKDIVFLKGRLRFEIDGEPRGTAPFPSALITYSKEEEE